MLHPWLLHPSCCFFSRLTRVFLCFDRQCKTKLGNDAKRKITLESIDDKYTKLYTDTVRKVLRQLRPQARRDNCDTSTESGSQDRPTETRGHVRRPTSKTAQTIKRAIENGKGNGRKNGNERAAEKPAASTAATSRPQAASAVGQDTQVAFLLHMDQEHVDAVEGALNGGAQLVKCVSDGRITLQSFQTLRPRSILDRHAIRAFLQIRLGKYKCFVYSARLVDSLLGSANDNLDYFRAGELCTYARK
jgi:hypothetical protein